MAIVLNGTTGVTTPGIDAAAGNADLTTLSVAGNEISAVNSLGFRNRIINGDMQIDQRNAGASVTPTDNQYLVDRWVASRSQASKYSAQQNAGSVTPPVGFVNYLGFTSLSAYSSLSTDYFGFSQIIEGLNASDFGWGTANAQAVTLSFWVRSSLTGTHSGSIRNAGNTRSYPFSFTINSANTWEQETIVIPGDTTGTWLTTNGVGISVGFNLGTGSTYLGSAGSWSSSNYNGVTGSVSVVGTNGATFYITGVQLEAGTVASPFERRDYGRELIMCQRYYERGFTNSNGCVSSATTEGQIQIRFKVTKRAAATLSVVAGASLTDCVTEIGTSLRTPTSISGVPDTNSVTAVTVGATYAATFRPLLLATDVLQVSAEL